MSYELVITVDAELDLNRLIDNLPKSRRVRALEAVEECLRDLAADPANLGVRSPITLSRPTFPVRFKVDDCHYDWFATFVFQPGETEIAITHMFRLQL